jgi:hypothetical protein
VRGPGGRLYAAAAMLVIAGWIGVAQGQSGPPDNNGERAEMDETFQIGIEDGGRFIPLATVRFDETHTGVMTLGAPHPETMRLIDAWTELVEADVLEVKRSGRGVHEETGEPGFVTRLVEVPQGREDFPDAVLTHLAQDHGFVAVQVAPTP